LIFVALAEMSDKTQLLAMAFATHYKATTVLWRGYAMPPLEASSFLVEGFPAGKANKGSLPYSAAISSWCAHETDKSVS